MTFAGFLSLGVVLAGGSFDFWRYLNAQASLQNSVDQAALVAKGVEARYVATNGILNQTSGQAKGETEGKTFYQNSLQSKQKIFGGSSFADPTFTWDSASGNVTVNAVASIPSFFNSAVFPAEFYQVKATAQATFDVGMATEIALVLDNTGSMFSFDGRSKTRFTLMREATLTFVNNVFDSAKISNNPEAVRMAVIPFATTVNIRGEAPAAQDFSTYSMATPTDGGSKQAVLNPMSRTGVVSVDETQYAPVSWRGCITGSVESRTNYTDTSITGWQTPVVPSSGSLSTYTYQTSASGYSCSGSNQSMKSCSSGSGLSNYYLKTPLTCLSSRPNSCTTTSTIASLTKTIQPCVADYNEPGIQNGTVPWCSWVTKTAWESQGGNAPPAAGPNENCTSPMLGLSGNRKQVIESVNRMTPANGGTHQDVGLRWGMRALSPNGGWPGFFGLTKAPKEWGTSVDKVLVLITDGQNTEATSPGYWGCSSCGTTASRSQLDTMMLSWCSAIRNDYKAKIYTVAVNVNDATAINLLKSCVGTGNESRAFTVDAANLQDALKSIGRELTKLKLVK